MATVLPKPNARFAKTIFGADGLKPKTRKEVNHDHIR